MAVRPPSGVAGLSRRNRLLIGVGLALLVVLFFGSRLIGTYVDLLWFREVGFTSVFTTILLTRVVLFLVFAVVVAAAVAGALLLAYRSRPVFVPVAGPDDPVARYRTTVMSRPKLFGLVVPAAVGVLAGLVAQNSWTVVQLFLNGTNFGQTDPEFGLDLGFYAFDLPFYRLVLDWVFVIVVLAFIGSLITHYLFGGLRLAGRGGQLTRAARIQLASLAGLFVLAKAVAYFLDRYQLLSSTRSEVFTGATYTDLNAVLPARLILLAIAVICAVAFFSAIVLGDLRIPAVATALLVFSSVLIGAAWPAVLQQFSVNPNEAERESESIARNIAATREAYGITEETVTYRDYSGTSTVEAAEVAQDTATISNVRLLDPTVVSDTFTQQRQQENFYGFPPVLDTDRYMVDGELRDYVIAARELNPEALTGNQTNWVNKHTVFTHGNGIVAAPANRVDAPVEDTGSAVGGYPVYTVSDLSTEGDIPVDNPRIYYGELISQMDPDYSIVGSGGEPTEYDTANEQFSYDGDGGVPIGNIVNRTLFAAQYAERNILFSDRITDESKIVFKRDPRDRVQEVAPWLTTDANTYPAVVDGEVKWIVDGYTTLDSLPYAQRTALEDVTTDSLETTGVRTQPPDTVSYIRNSVKATVDAYDGTVTLYAVDETDPVLQAWTDVFPGVVQPQSEVTDELRQHFRYPQDLFKVQRDLLTRYQVSDPQEFFNSTGFWDVPTDPTQDGDTGLSQPPYYVVAASPDDGEPSYQLTSALTGFNREFLAAYLTASSDPETYGELTVLQLPTNSTTQGPQQVQNTMVSSDEVARDLALFRNQQNTSVTFGNLLTLPVGDGGLLYVEPLYIQRSNQDASFPQLIRVLVTYGARVGYAPTLAGALEQVFGAGAGDTTTPPVDENGADAPSTPAEPTTPPADPASPAPDAPPAGALSPEEATANLSAAIEDLRAAQTSGDLGALGQAIDALDTAVQQYQDATGQTPATPPAPAPGG